MKEESSLLGLKVLSLVLAVGLWFAVNLERPSHQGERVVEASVTYSTPANLILLEPPSKVQVRIQGRESLVSSLNPQMVYVRLDLTDAEAGTVEISLGPENVSVPPGLDVLSITPGALSLDFDFLDTRVLPVQARIEGEPAAGAKVISRVVVPDRVTISGPRSMVARTRSLETEVIRLDSHALSFEETVAVRTPDPLISAQPARVRVRLELEIEERAGRRGGGEAP